MRGTGRRRQTWRRLAVAVCGVSGLVLLAGPAVAGGGGGGGSVCRGFGSGDEIRLRDNCFEAIGHVVESGTTLRVENLGEAPHTYTAVDGSFDSGVLQPGEHAEVEISDVGTVPVRCTLHSDDNGHGMTGLLVVAGSAGTGEVGAAGTRDVGAAAVVLSLLAVGILAAAVIVHRRRGTTGSDPTPEALSSSR